MSVILVLEQDAGYAGRISSLLRAAGHEVHVVQGLDHALQIASARSPELFLASGSNAGAADLLERFSRRRGGPGSVVLLPSTLAEQVQAADYHADEILTKPFNESDLQAMARRFLAAEAPMPAKNQLTSADIFGDVLAEVEAEAQKSAAARRSTSSHDDINRKLEETLAGVFPMAERPRSGQSANSGAAPAQRPPTLPPSLSAPTSPSVPVPAARPLPSGLESVADAPRRARPLPPSADEIDDLLDKTLSSLELPRQRRPAAPAPAAPPTVARPSAPAPAVPAPTVPAPIVPAPIVPVPIVPVPRAPAAAPIAAAPIATPTVTRSAPATVPPATVPPAAVPTSAAPAAATFRPAPAASPPNFSLPAPAPLSSAPTSPPPVPPRAAPAPPLPARPVPLEDPFAFLPPPASVAPAGTAMDDSSPSFFSTPSAAFDLPNESQLPPPRFENSGARAESFFGGDAAKPADDPWSSDVWGAAPDFSSPGPARPTTESFKAIDSPPAEAEADAWSLPPTDDTGWSVSSFDEVPTPNLKVFPEPATGQLANAAAAPHDFASAFAPPAETGSFVNPLPRPRDNSKVSTSDFGLPNESDPGLQALDGVLQIRADHNTGRPEGDFEGTPFGDYRLMERVAIGGMAEVWRARRRGVEGFQKTVAIKKILSHLTGSVDFVTMFIDEAKLAAQLSHNNIIQIYDLGKVDDDFYIAMEYVEGWDLRTILAAGRERGLPLPMPLALAIAAAVARALDYAHRKRDFSNRALGLVHRDVSPQNVLISHEGEIKLCDFGIVKAVSKASTTQMGALKGKLQYMSPEQAWGREVDARSDIFSLGSVLFEVLTGTKLFTGDSEIGVLDAVRDCRIRSPREIVPGIQEEVERIVFRSLAKNPEDRYSTAGQLEKDITAVLDGLRLTPGQGDLAEYLQLLFNTPLLRHEPGRAIAPPLPALAPGPPEDLSGRQGVKPAQPGAAPKDGKKSPVVLIAVGVFLLLVLLILGYFLLAEKSPDEAAPATAEPTAIESATGEGATGEGALPAAGAAEASPDVVRQMVNEQLDARQKEIEKDYDERRRKLEEELAKVQRENAKAGAKKPAGGGNSP